MNCGQIIFTHLPSHGDIPAIGSSSQSAQVRQSSLGEESPSHVRGQASSVAPSKPFALCPWCTKTFGRKQELKRHILSLHLPNWICCPHPSCPWRGARTEDLKKHMRNGQCGPEAQPEQYKIYEPKGILDGVFDDSEDTPVNLKLFFAEMDAVDLVLERAVELQKVELWEDPWGRRPKEISNFDIAS